MQVFAACFLESLDSMEQAELGMEDEQLYYRNKFVAHLLQEAIKAAGFDLALNFKSFDTASLFAFIDQFE